MLSSRDEVDTENFTDKKDIKKKDRNSSGGGILTTTGEMR